MNDFLQNVAQAIERDALLEPGSRVIVALSGGADSTALLAALAGLGYECMAAHCDFHLRGDESERDRIFAESLASRLGASYREIHFDVEAYRKSRGVSVEMACRDLRYEWFDRLSIEEGGIPVAVAHHRDDNVETMMLNLLRGTGIAGLRGMMPKNGNVIRPFLRLTRADIENFLRLMDLPYITDSSNLVSDVKRNKLRNIILPMLRQEFPDCDKGLAASLDNLAANAALYAESIDWRCREFVKEGGSVVDLLKIKEESDSAATLLYEIIKPLGFNGSQAADMVECAESGRRFYSSTHQALLDRGMLYLKNRDEVDEKSESLSIDLEDESTLPQWLEVDIIDRSELVADRSGMTLYLDPSALEGHPRFTLRHWCEGDRIAPFGMKGTRLVSDIFSDAKLSLDEKAAVWLLERDGALLWVIGHRASSHFIPGGTQVVRLNANL